VRTSSPGVLTLPDTLTGPPVRVALVGATGYGESHRRVIAALARTGRVELVGLADLRDIPDAPPGVPVFTSHRDLLDAVRADIVVVSTPPHTHLPIAADAARAGADVLLEKPPVRDRAEFDELSTVLAQTGRRCQVGFQALGSPALAALLAAVDAGELGELRSITVRGCWFRDESYFTRASWVGKASLGGRPVLDGALANPFAHALMHTLAIARQSPTGIEVERYRTRDIQVDDTATLRLTFPDGLRALLAVTLCADEYVAGEIVVTGSAGTAVLEYPTDRLRLPADADLVDYPERPNLLANLIAHRADPHGVPLLVPLSRTAPFVAVVEAVSAAPVTPIGPRYLTTCHDLPQPRLVLTGAHAAVSSAARELALFSELNLPWAARTAHTPAGRST
jgi:predicted dehydrogenase